MSLEAILKTFDLAARDLALIPVSALAFVAFIALMRKYFFGPYLALLDAREAVTAGAEDDASSMTKEALEIQAQTEAKLTAARVELMRKRLAAVQAVKAESATLLHEAETAAQNVLTAGRATLTAQRQEAYAKLRGEAEEMTRLVVQRVMGATGGGEPSTH